MEQNSKTDAFMRSRGWLTFVAITVVFAVSAVFGIRYLGDQQRILMERQRADRRQESFNNVKYGDRRVSILDPELLPMLANDADCVANVEELGFFMTEITADDSQNVSKLTNVKRLFFYDTRGADHVLENAQSLPIKTMVFESTRLSKNSLRTLSQFPELTELYFGYVVSPSEVAILDMLPPRIAVSTPHLSENQPAFIELGEP